MLDGLARAVLIENLRRAPLPLAAVRQASSTVYSCRRLIVYPDLWSRLSHANLLYIAQPCVLEQSAFLCQVHDGGLAQSERSGPWRKGMAFPWSESCGLAYDC